MKLTENQTNCASALEDAWRLMRWTCTEAPFAGSVIGMFESSKNVSVVQLWHRPEGLLLVIDGFEQPLWEIDESNISEVCKRIAALFISQECH
ncbi:hypothetical protein DS891_01535 [Pseudoalteromonas sp. JC28]|uniref:hypothetical protein n=1 Tax=Pseudoalteromonas TaxID=53246 RepID=UPI00157445D4|nr:hypothetical protein [Pseudoalteromonas sp. JC28]NSY32291.1 hypothetical protein [Pseudoalteromonas sp. JC28]